MPFPWHTFAMAHSTDPYLPSEVFGAGEDRPPRALIAPGRYIQGNGALDRLGTYLGLVESKRPGVLGSPRRLAAYQDRMETGLDSEGIAGVFLEFGGEASLKEIEGRAADFTLESVDAVIAFGGGKCIDAGKAIAHRLGVSVVIVPTLASNDAPCSALSVIYNPDGEVEGVEFFPSSPALVVVDTGLVASAPARFLVAGMGDAMATWYEARAVASNPDAVTTIGGSQTLAANAIGEVCASTLFRSGADAVGAVAANEVDRALEDVVEANTLLSGIGFESGGLAVAHAVASALTMLPEVHGNHLHGEMVAIGTLAQLIIEDDAEELEQVRNFFAEVGLPTRLSDISIDSGDSASIEQVAEESMTYDFIHNVGSRVEAGIVAQTLKSLGTD